MCLISKKEIMNTTSGQNENCLNFRKRKWIGFWEMKIYSFLF